MIEAVPRKGNPLGRVLFLCGHNYHESRFCEELFNSHARTEGLNWQASSRAVVVEPAAKNDGPISIPAVEYLRLLGAAPVNHLRLPLRATDFDFRMSAAVIALDRALEPLIAASWPRWASEVRYWRAPGFDAPRSQAALAHLSRDVRALADALRCRERGHARGAFAPLTTS